MMEGTLIVVVSRAANLHNKRNVSKQNPFCALRIQNLVHKTKTIIRGGQNPAWDFEARYKLHEDLDSRFLKISVFDQNGSNVDLIGDCSVDLGPAFSASVDDGYDAWHPITFGGKKTGEIYLEITYYPKRRRQSRTSASLSASQQSFRQTTLSPSASMSSLSSIGSMSSRRPLPALPGLASNSSPNLAGSTISRSPSPLRQSLNGSAYSRNTAAVGNFDPNRSIPTLGDNSFRNSDLDLANYSMPDLRPSMNGAKYGSRPMSPSRSSQQLHTNLSTRIPHSQSARSLHNSYLPRYEVNTRYDDDEANSNEDLDIPEPPQHSQMYSSSPVKRDFEFDLPQHIPKTTPGHDAKDKDKKNVSHINAWYGKAMFHRFRK